MESELRPRHELITQYPETNMSPAQRRSLNVDHLKVKLTERGEGARKQQRRAEELRRLQAKIGRANFPVGRWMLR